MISKNSFSKEWILRVKGSERNDQSVIERQIYALHLLEELCLLSQTFIFKGGTSLSLLTDEFPRFSVDIDILVDPASKDFFCLENLNRITEHSRFIKVKEDVRVPRYDIDKRHFVFFFNGIFSMNAYVLLDIVFDKSHYQDIQRVRIKNYLLDTSEDVTRVNMPSIHDLLADKLGAFAPNTIGKKLGEGRDVEVIKQMYDVWFLMKHYSLSPSFDQIYLAMANAEILRRGLTCDFKTPIIDTIRTAGNILTEGKLDPNQYVLLKAAIRKFVNYVRDLTFTVELAKTGAIYSIYAALLVLSGGKDRFDQFSNEQVEFLDSYKVFIPTKRWLRRANNELYELFDKCLHVMGYFSIHVI
jgi:predicted nucleotidyltransferase component of viral defense system